MPEPGLLTVTAADGRDLLDAFGAGSQFQRLAIVMTRERVAPIPPRSDLEPTLSREFTLPTARTFTLTGSATVNTLIPDATVDTMVGRPGVAQGAVTASSSDRLPGDLRVAPVDAALLLRERFVKPLVLGSKASQRIPDVLARLGIAGGAVYDALVALAAVEHGADLATRDLRAKATYEAVGANVLVAG